MDKTIILKNALELIAQGTVDVQYPLRCAPREILMKCAKDALGRYKDAILTSAMHPDGEGSDDSQDWTKENELAETEGLYER